MQNSNEDQGETLHPIENLTDQEILNFLQERSRTDNFLLLISSNVLRSAARQRQYQEDIRARRYTGKKISVINLTIEELKKACLTKNLINYFDFMNYQYTINHHSLLGMKLVVNCPDQYEVGGPARQYQISRSNLLNKQYARYMQRQVPNNQRREQQNQSQDSDFLNNQYAPYVQQRIPNNRRRQEQSQNQSLEGFIVDDNDSQDYDGDSVTLRNESVPQDQQGQAQSNKKENIQRNQVQQSEVIDQKYLVNPKDDIQQNEGATRNIRPLRNKRRKLNQDQANEFVAVPTKKRRSKMMIDDD